MPGSPPPISRAERLTQRYGKEIWIKHDDETGCVLSGNKIRKLQYIAHHATTEGVDTLVTCGGVQSNHCRTTAGLARRLGMEVELFLRGPPPKDADGQASARGNLFLDQLFGARIHWVTPEEYNHASSRDQRMKDRAAKLRRRGRNPLVIAEGASIPLGCWGYIEACQEIREQQQDLGFEFDAIVHAVGSGGTSAGLEIGRQLHGLSARVVGVNVCDDAPSFRRRITALIHRTREQYGLRVRLADHQPLLVDGYVGPGYGAATPEILDALALAAELDGLVLDPTYTAKAFFGMLSELGGQLEFARRLLFVHTGGIFGLLAGDAPLRASPGTGHDPPHAATRHPLDP